MNREGFRAGSQIEKEEFLVISEGSDGYTIDYVDEDAVCFEVVVVWEDRKLRDRIVELLNKHGTED
jgi:hypothetical protein